MKTLTETEAKRAFTEVLETSSHERISITRNGKPGVVMIPESEYARLEQIEDAVWAARADVVLSMGSEFLGPEKSMAFIREMLARTDADA